MKKQPPVIAFAVLFAAAVLVLGYVLLGFLPMLLFAFGFLGGFVLWILVSTNVPFLSIKIPFFLSLAFFVLHKFEERYMDFFPRLAEITGVPVPDTDSLLVFLLYAFAAAWLLIPYLIGRKSQFGYYRGWTFFVSMGVTELAHFVLPFFEGGAYGYFPGMASTLLLAPAAWWGIWRLSGRQ